MVLTKWEARPYFTAVWVWDNSAGAYINNTLEAHSKNGTAFSIFADANDYIYLVCQSAGDADYSAGKFLIELWGTV